LAEAFKPRNKTMNSFFKTFRRFADRTGTLVILAAIFSAGCASTDRPVAAAPTP
jgi:hypothetical protein